MGYPFFRPQEVHAEAVILVGYRMYPYVRIELHPRLTLLSGGNGAGKTTLLDSLQTIIIADQRYLHLNVAAGQNDRDIGGQLQDRVAWAVIQIEGHPEIEAIGTCLTRRAAAEYVDIKPFALIGTAPEKSLFLNSEMCSITPDLRALHQNVRRCSLMARVKEFASINEYHCFLYDEGLFPLDLSRGGKRQFSLLWRQATQPHLGELNSFLQKTLCHEPEKRLTFEDVERLMQERIHAERQLNRLGELKALNAELHELAGKLDQHRRRFLGINLGLARQRQESLIRDIEEGEQRFRELDEHIRALKEELDAFREKLEDIGRDRDRYLREQGEWSRKYKHHKEYVAHKRLLDESQEEISWVQEEIYPLEVRLTGLRERIEKLREEMQLATNDLARMKEKEGELERQKRKWLEFRKDLERAVEVLGKEIYSAAELENAWSELGEERRRIQELKPLRQLLAQWESRSKAHDSACESGRRMIDLWPEFFRGKDLNRELLEEAQSGLRAQEKEIAIRKEELVKSKKPLTDLINELPRGRLPLPSTAAELVELGQAQPFIRHFDNLDLKAARDRQEIIGPLAWAIEPSQCDGDTDTGEEACTSPLAQLAHGSEPFWLVIAPDVWKEFHILEQTEHGTIAGYGGIAWYTPDGPVWIGAEARREQIRKAQERILEVEAQMKELGIQEDLISKRMSAIQSFLPRLDAFSDSEAFSKAEELKEWVQQLERRSPKVEKLYPMLQRLFQRSELFHFIQAPEAMEALEAEMSEKQEKLRETEGTLKTLRTQDAESAKELNSLRAKLQSMERDADRIWTICSRLEEEEPAEVLQGRVDFGRAEELAARILELEKEKDNIQNSLLSGERKHGELRNRYRAQGEMLAKVRHEYERSQNDHIAAQDFWRIFYPEEEPQYISGFRVGEREEQKALWDSLVQALTGRLSEVAERYEIRIPEEDQPDSLVLHLLQLLLPPGVEITQLESQYQRLRCELQEIENKIKGHVEEVRANVEGEVRRLRIHLARVNRILSTLHFGQIKRIYLELEELPAYHALKKLESLVQVITKGEAVTLRDFIEKLRSFIQKESNTTLSEEQIADYRSYIRIRRVIVDANDNAREGGLSSGETLGVNLSLCLAVLFFLGREQGSSNNGGMLLLALDEAERLDGKALETIRSILDEVRCQLTVAMPRPVDIPDSICHLLTPLTQGVTHVHLYYKGENGNGKPEAVWSTE